MKKFKIIVFGGEEPITREFDNLASNEEEAVEIASKLFKEYDDGNYPDLRVDIYPKGEYIPLPIDDYPVVFKDADGFLCKGKMRVGTYSRIGISSDFEVLEDYKFNS